MMAAVGPLGEGPFSESPPIETAIPTRSLHVLVAEDSPVNQHVAAALLEKWGHRVTVAGNGRQALAAVTAGRFDLILMDVQMPEMDGLEATAAIRKREQSTGEHIPIVALTAHAMKGDRDRCLASGMDAYVTKPIRSKELARVIHDVTDPAQNSAGFKNAGNTDASKDDPRSACCNNWDEALAALHGDRQLLAELVEIFCEECPKLREQIATALGSGDAKTLQRSAHTLKGSLSHIAASKAHALAEQIEVLAKQGELTAAVPLWSKLQVELDELNPTLTEFLQGSTTSKA
jgi:CheY-like chemotaxis protein